MPDTIKKSFQPNNREISYINKDFNSFKAALIDYAKTYFPKTYKDFSDASPGMMFIEMASYVGDVLSYYTDYQFKESLMPYAQERKNVIALAKYLGYKIKPVSSANVTLDVFQLVPSIKDSNNNYIPDENYTLKIREYMEVSSNNNTNYIVLESIDFSVNTPNSPREDVIYSRDSYGIPQFFLLKKTVNAIAGTILQKNVSIKDPIPYNKIQLDEKNVIEIIDVRDSDNNRWYEVDFLAQDLIYTEIENSILTNQFYYQYNKTVPKLIRPIKTYRKFITNVNSDNTTYLEFGPGTENIAEDIVYPNYESVKVGLTNVDLSQPRNFLNSNTLGQTPFNTTLTIKYIVGGGIDSNALVGDVNKIVNVQFLNDITSLNPSQANLLQTTQRSLSISNITAAVGGGSDQTIDDIKQNALAHFASQNRAVTSEDYINIIYSMPAKFGSVSKVTVLSNNGQNSVSGYLTTDNRLMLEENVLRRIDFNSTNPFSINVYALSYDENKKLSKINDALSFNIKNYLQKYKLLTDSVNIIDGYVINIGVEFKISTYKNYNKREVLDECLTVVKNFFNIDNWGFNQPINLSQLELEIAKVEGVESVAEVKIKNLTNIDGNYSSIEYNIGEATQNKIIYPSLDPCVFEVKYPDTDIKGFCL